jgi:pilus assembly protein CpaE
MDPRGGDVPANSEASIVSVAVIDPDPTRRGRVIGALKIPQVGAIRQMDSYLGSAYDGNWLTTQNIDVALVALDHDPEKAFQTIKSICSVSSVTVMVYSDRFDQQMLMRAMRSGAREFLRYPIERKELESALDQAAERARAVADKNKGYGNLLVFLGSKGGVGTTTVACNFAVSLARETGKKVLLIDLDLPLGDVALDLGIRPRYSTLDALVNAGRLDASFLGQLLVAHESGVAVLAAPGTHSTVVTPEAAVQKLLVVSRQEFDHVVVDAGATSGLIESLLLQLATSIYLVAQAGIAELRNANRLISGGLSEYTSKLQIVLNRYSADSMGIDDDAIRKALTRVPDWCVPNDYAEVRKMQNTATPFALNDTAIARLIRNMARYASGMGPEPEPKKRFGLFR